MKNRLTRFGVIVLAVVIGFSTMACPSDPPATTVTNVTVSPASHEVERGGTLYFSAAVVGTNNPPQGVTWSVDGMHWDTQIDENGVLRVAATESNETLTVRATSTFDSRMSGTAFVDLTLPVAETVPGDSLAEQLYWLRLFAQSGNHYFVEIMANETIAPEEGSHPRQPTLPTGRNDIAISLSGRGAMRTISLSGNGYLFAVSYGITPVLDRNITLNGRDGNNTSLVRVDNGGTLIMNEGSRITGNNQTWHIAPGGGVRVNIGGTFTMYGGEISGNAAAGSGLGINGGGVSVASGGTFTMHGGEIAGNNAGGNGGGVSVASGGTFAMHGGEIAGNNAGGGGGVYVASGGTFAMHGGEIAGNNAGSGGGVSVVSGGTFAMHGGEIAGNNAEWNGGGVWNGGTFRMVNGLLHGSGTGENSNTAYFGGAALATNHGTAQIGSFTLAGVFIQSSTLATTNATIQVIDGFLHVDREEDGTVMVPGDSLVEQLAWVQVFAVSGGEYIYRNKRQ